MMEIDILPPPLPAHNFSLDSSSCSSPYLTAPSSPLRFPNFFFSPPSSPKPRDQNVNLDSGYEDFEFNFSNQLGKTSSSADELFYGGKILPLKPPPRFDQFSTLFSPGSPKSRVSPKKEYESEKKTPTGGELGRKQRGRRNHVHKGSRSLSPLRVSDIMVDEYENDNSDTGTTPKSYASTILSAISFSKGTRKWRLRDFLLFRSASEGRATSKEIKYTLLERKESDDRRNLSFRSIENEGSGSRPSRGRVSAHELHYTANRAVAEEMKRKTFLPYKQGLLGCLRVSGEFRS